MSRANEYFNFMASVIKFFSNRVLPDIVPHSKDKNKHPYIKTSLLTAKRKKIHVNMVVP